MIEVVHENDLDNYADIDDLRKSLSNFIKDNTPQVAGTDEVDTQPTLGVSVWADRDRPTSASGA